MQHDWLKFVPPRALIAALLVAVFVAYAPGLGGGFVFDDYPNIVANQYVHIQDLSPESLARAAKAYEVGPYGRPLATIGFGVDHYLGGGSPLPFKLHSLLVHLLNTLLVFLLVRHVMRRLLPSGANEGPVHDLLAPMAVAAVWALHPLQVSTVLYVVQRMEMLSATFMLLALLCYVRARIQHLSGATGLPWLLGASASAVLAPLAKENAINLLLYGALMEWLLFRFRDWPRPLSVLIRPRLVLTAAVALVLAMLFGPLLLTDGGVYPNREFSAGQRLLTQPGVLALYLAQVAFPTPGLMPFYYDNFPIATGPFSPWWALPAMILHLAALVLAFRLAPPRPLLAFGILWFYLSHVLTSGSLNLELVFEHRNYLASLGLILILADILLHPGTGVRGRLILALTGLLLVGSVSLTAIRAATWGDELVLAKDWVARNPTSVRASSDLAVLYGVRSGGDSNSQDFQKAMDEFERGAALPSPLPLPEQGLISLAGAAGLPVPDAWWDRLITKLRNHRISPQAEGVVISMVNQHLAGVPLDTARVGVIFKLLADARQDATTNAQYADFALDQLKDADEALRYFRRALDLSKDPRFAPHLLRTLESEGQQEIVERLRG